MREEGRGRALAIGLVWAALVPFLALGDAPTPIGFSQAYAVESALTASAPLIAAHRGGNPLEPENSLPAFRGAMNFGADYLEFDVHQTRDGALVIMHDPTLERTSTGEGAIGDLSLAEVRRFKLLHPTTGEDRDEIPTLEQLLVTLDARVRLLLEIKHPGPGRRYDGIEARVAEALERYHLVGRTRVISFDLEDLARVKAADPRIEVAGLLGMREVEQGVEPRFFLDSLADLGAWGAALDWRLIDADLVRAAHRRGMLVGAWTVNDLAVVDQLSARSIDLLISDRAQALIEHFAPSPRHHASTALVAR